MDTTEKTKSITCAGLKNHKWHFLTVTTWGSPVGYSSYILAFEFIIVSAVQSMSQGAILLQEGKHLRSKYCR